MELAVVGLCSLLDCFRNSIAYAIESYFLHNKVVQCLRESRVVFRTRSVWFCIRSCAARLLAQSRIKNYFRTRSVARLLTQSRVVFRTRSVWFCIRSCAARLLAQSRIKNYFRTRSVVCGSAYEVCR